MPTLRILAEGQSYLASPGTMCGDVAVFHVAEGETVPLTLDYVGFLGSDTAASSVWSGDLSAGGAALANGVASARFAIPDGSCSASEILNTLTTTGGRVKKTTVVLATQPNWYLSAF